MLMMYSDADVLWWWGWGMVMRYSEEDDGYGIVW